MIPVHQTLRFVHPDFDAAAPSGLVLGPTGRPALVDGHASVRQALLILLSTNPGERVMRPRYGCDLHRLLVAPNDASILRWTSAGIA